MLKDSQIKVPLEIKDSKASFILELLKSLDFVKFKQLSNEKSEQTLIINTGLEELKLIKVFKL